MEDTQPPVKPSKAPREYKASVRKLNAWTIMAPHAKVSFRHTDLGMLAAFESELALFPGVKKQKSGYFWTVPDNALVVVNRLCGKYGVEITTAKWVVPPPKDITWPEVKEKLRKGGEVRPQYLEGFATPYQERGVAFTWLRTGTHIWISTGAGKSLIALFAGLSVPGPLLFIVRTSARPKIVREAERFLAVKAYGLKPASLQRKKDGTLDDYLTWCRDNKQRPVIVVGWDSLTLRLEELLSIRFGTVIFDESHNGKGQKRWDVVHLPELPDDPEEAREKVKRWEAEAEEKQGFLKQEEESGLYKMMIPVINRAAAAARIARNCTKRICLSASPVSDRVRDLWAQLDLAEPNSWGNATQWCTRYANRHQGKYGIDTRGTSNLDELTDRLNCAFILTYAQTHSDLPPKRREPYYIAPEDQVNESTGFKKMMKEAEARGGTNLLEAKLMLSASRKRKAVLELVLDHLVADQKVVLFTGRRQDCEKLGEDVASMPFVKKNSCKVWTTHGGHSVDERDKYVQAYMSHPGPCVLVGTGHSLGESIDLNDTDAAIFVMLPLTPGMLRQWEGRFQRRGGKRPVIIYYAIAEGTVDEHMATILIEKLPAVEKVVQDSELAEAATPLSGWDPNISDDDFAASILSNLDYGGSTGDDEDEGK